jgi:hypothetical protein
MRESMYLLRARLHGIPPFDELELPFHDAGGPRRVTVVHGGAGVGKTALLHALASTRPGHTAVPAARAGAPEGPPPHAVCEWTLGRDDPDRPHPLVITSPNVRPPGDDESATLHRREQALFDRVARERGGFVFLSISGARWFSRQPMSLHAPRRTVASYDVRSTASFDDAAHSDLTRETKQALAYAGISAALAPTNQQDRVRWRERSGSRIDTRLLGVAMREVVDAMARLAGFSYEGIDPVSLEPTFSTPGRTLLTFERLPTRARHLVAFAALPVRTLWAAYPGEDPRTQEGVVAIDELDLRQDDAVAERILATLRLGLPGVQWIATTTSSVVASSVAEHEVLALRRLPEREVVELFLGTQARTH